MRILVTGGTGLVGSNVIKVAREDCGAEVVAALYARKPEVPWVAGVVHLDLEEPASVRMAVEEHQPQAVIHCAAPRDEDRLEVDHEWGWRVMVAGTRAMADACRAVGARLVFVSSDWVFGQGGQPPYGEGSPPCPANYFGLLKVVGETLVSSRCEDYAIVRIAGVYGPNWSYPSHVQTEAGMGFGWLANHYVHRLSQRRRVAVWTDHVNVRASPSLASDVARVLLTLAHGDQQGIFHGCGRDGVSRLDLAQAVAGAFGFDRELVRAATPEEMDVGHLRGKLSAPRDSRLQVAGSEARLNRTNLGLGDGLEEYRRQLQDLQRS
jgi:dTDP-4-dehydrorhamnose reductase